MVKKKKISELDDDQSLVDFAENNVKERDLTKINIDNLKDDTVLLEQSSLEGNANPIDNESLEKSKKVLSEVIPIESDQNNRIINKADNSKSKANIHSSTDSTISNPKSVENFQKQKQKQKLKRIIFEINFLKSYFQKLLSYMFILVMIDVVHHAFKFFDKIDIFSINNFSSIYFEGSIITIVIKLVVFLLFVYFFNFKKGLVADPEGIFCTQTALNGFFYRSERVYMEWSKIKSAKMKHKLFETYIYLYGKDDIHLGSLYFCLENEKLFYDFIQKSAGLGHPLFLLSKES